MIIASDGVSSYALFLYADLDWSQTDSRSIGSGYSGASGSGDNNLSSDLDPGSVVIKQLCSSYHVLRMENAC